MLVSFDIFAFDLDLISLGCVAPMAPVAKFTMRTLLVLVLFAVACLVHFFFIAMFQKGKGLQLSLLDALDILGPVGLSLKELMC